MNCNASPNVLGFGEVSFAMTSSIFQTLCVANPTKRLSAVLLLYTLLHHGKLDWSCHAGSLPVREDAYERHKIVFKGVIGRRRASEVPRVSFSNNHGDIGARGSRATKARMEKRRT